MQKLSLERFREIKKRVAEIFNLVAEIEEEKEEMPIKFTRTPEYWTNDLDDKSSNELKDRYIRTGIGVEDIDYIVSDEWKPSLGYEMAMAGINIPVKDGQEQLVFSEET